VGAKVGEPQIGPFEPVAQTAVAPRCILEHHMSLPAPVTPAEAKVVWDRMDQPGAWPERLPKVGGPFISQQ
jgi:hypothetical protein